MEESQEVTLARFLHGLTREVQDKVELHQYNTLKDLVHQATKVESQLQRKLSSRNPSTSWKGKKMEKERSRRDKTPKKGIKCFKCMGKWYIAFQCPNKRFMVLRENEEVESEKTSSLSGGESFSEGSHYEGDLLMVRRLMTNLVGEDTEIQRETIFNSRCLDLGKLCSLIIDGGSSVNVARLRLVRMLLAITLGSYKDDILCDMVPMEATHFLLGRPLQYDRKVTHDGVSNNFNDMLKKYKGIFPKEICHEFPPLRGIEHHIGLIVDASLPKRPTYRASLEESKEI
ncbi:hypothetical protein CR513_23048, partial [Mucuna pruriens]